MFPPDDLDHARKVAEKTKSYGMEVASYGSYYRVGDRNDYPFEKIVETASALGATKIRVWPGGLGSNEADQIYRQQVIQDALRIAEIAEKEGISIHLEYHNGTLTDTKESARQLMEEISHDNVFLYWQPMNQASVEERLASIEAVRRWISNVHVFHWETWEKRYALAEGEQEWLAYLRKIVEDKRDRHLLMEFVKKDDEQQFLRDAKVLKDWIDNII
ncbi:TIM barrel protein [Gracilibacillus sp. JCM 18860]|uniref:TIM barrel protein n=1 Tax=Gracilibacillus sp. JCM 18860 TaxID=1306159 RepID=UPI0006D2368C